MKNKNLANIDKWTVPDYFYLPLNKEFKFDLKIDDHNEYYLKNKWDNCTFINPPHDKATKELYVFKALEESKRNKCCVLLLPVSTSAKLFHKYILPNAKEIRFVEKRIKFKGVNSFGEFVTDKTGMYDSMIVIFDGRKIDNTKYSLYSSKNDSLNYNSV